VHRVAGLLANVPSNPHALRHTYWLKLANDGVDSVPAPVKSVRVVPSCVTFISMSASLQRAWTQDEFFAWAQKQDRRYEFDGVQPVAMTGGTVDSGDLLRNLTVALATRLRGGTCKNYGPENGVATVGKTVRYPDGLITCSKQEGTSKLVADVVVIFEIVSPSSIQMHHVVKVREYAAVPSIRRYVIIESTSKDVTVMERKDARVGWFTTMLTVSDILKIPEVGIEIPVAELYEGVSFAEQEASTG
jgi:Uma2 family endonuclease